MKEQESEMRTKKRETFTTGMAVFFATLGSAVGLGNIWKFPYLTGKNGGGAFLLTYVLCIIFVGLPVMIGEFYIGRKSRSNAVGAFDKLGAKPFWKSIGFMGVIAAFLIMFFYSCVAGWVYSYVFKAIEGQFKGITIDQSGAIFTKTLIGPVPPIIWQVIVMVVVSIILILGVQKGIERVTKTLMPVLFILIIICDIRALTLPGAMKGVDFLFHVNFANLTGESILIAMGLAFFKLSIGMGTMITYGSYFTEDNNMVGTAAKVAASDTIVSILAGLAIFPAVFAFGAQPDKGPGLLFVTIPMVFSKMPFGSVLMVAFFFLTSIAATTAMISLVEVPVAYFSEEKKMSRKKAVIITSVIILVIGLLATLSADTASLLGWMRLSSKGFLDKGFFDWFDYLSSNVLMPLGGLLIVLFVGWFNKKDDIKAELTNNGSLGNGSMIEIYYFVARYITPVLILIIGSLLATGVLKV